RLSLAQRALWLGASNSQVHEATNIDPWFLDQIERINEMADQVRDARDLLAPMLFEAKSLGFSDLQLGSLRGVGEAQIRELRKQLGVRPVFKTVDTCAAEFEANTPYHYSTFDFETEVVPSDRRKIIILGSGPNRIGQGIEFDYSCVHAAMTLREAGYETIMINCNPETVSTDYDTSDRLYFEPLTFEDVMAVIEAESEAGELVGVIVQLGGQTPLGLAQPLADAGVPIIGTSPQAIHMAEDRQMFSQVLATAKVPAPAHGTARSFEQAREIADRIGYPVLVRPSYVLGGRGMEIVYEEEKLKDYLERATQINPEHPVLVDRFLDDAVEIDVDALFDGTDLYLAGVMEHIEEAGVHSGDSACVLPPITLGREEIDRIRAATHAIAAGVGVLGLINIQFALAADVLYILEANPRASRTVPFVSKATGVPIAKAAARIMAGESIESLRTQGVLPMQGDGGRLPAGSPVSVKEAVLPFGRFHGVDTVLGPEMKSTGEVMGIDASFGVAFAKSQVAAFAGGLPTQGTAFVSLANRDKRSAIFPVKRLSDLGFDIVATEGTADILQRNGIPVRVIRKQFEGKGPHGEPTAVDSIHSGDIDLIINTPYGVGPRKDGYEIRTAAVFRGVPCITTVQGLAAAVQGIESLLHDQREVKSIQEHARNVRWENV
nr:carbamoyl-phosphate synthase large subunit [Actinomycetes bacterium]